MYELFTSCNSYIVTASALTKNNKKNSTITEDTVNVERFAGLNICSFSPMKFFAEILSRCIGHQCSLLTYS